MYDGLGGAPSPTSVMSQTWYVSQFSAIATGFPVFVELTHFVPGQQVIADVLLPVGQLADAVGHHRSGDHGEQARRG